VLLCLLPTCAVALWAASRTGDGHRTRCAEELGRILGLKVTLGGVEHPEPSVVRYTGVVLADPETGESLVSMARLQVQSTHTAVVVSAPEVKIEPGAVPTVAELAHDWLRDRTEADSTSLRLSVGKLRVTSSGGDIPLFDVAARLEPTREGRGLELGFRTSEMKKNAEPVTLTMVRGRNARIGFELDSHGDFDPHWRRFSPVLQLLRVLVAANHVLVPVTPEAEALMKLSPAAL
jgi:hypothetical protein